MQFTRRLTTLALVAACSLAAPAHAALLTYSEAANGDILDQSPLRVFKLDTAGVNTISGASGNLPSGWDADSFALELVDGVEIVSLSMTNTNTGTVWRVGTGTAYFGGANLGLLMGNAHLTIGSPLTSNLNIVWSQMWSGVNDWSFRIETRGGNVTAVPEPAMPALVGLSLAALAFTRRRRR